MTINIDDRELYGFVSQEMANGIIDSGLMTKALAETDFNENKSKSLYIKMRVSDLSAQSKQQEKLLDQEALKAAVVSDYIRKHAITKSTDANNNLNVGDFKMLWNQFNVIEKVVIIGVVLLMIYIGLR